MRLLTLLSVFAFFAFTTNASLEEEAGFTLAPTLEQEISLLVTGDAEAYACSALYKTCGDSDQCCSSCCSLGTCYDESFCAAICIPDGSTIRSCTEGSDCCSSCCYNGQCQDGNACKAVFLVVIIWVAGICCSILCVVGIITTVICLVKKSRANNQTY